MKNKKINLFFKIDREIISEDENMIICYLSHNNEMKVCEYFLNQMYVNKSEDEYFADNMIIYIEKS